MEIRIESCKGAVVVESFIEAGLWLEEFQPSFASVTAGGLDLGNAEDLEDACDENGAYQASDTARALRVAHRLERLNTASFATGSEFV